MLYSLRTAASLALALSFAQANAKEAAQPELPNHWKMTCDVEAPAAPERSTYYSAFGTRGHNSPEIAVFSGFDGPGSYLTIERALKPEAAIQAARKFCQYNRLPDVETLAETRQPSAKLQVTCASEDGQRLASFMRDENVGREIESFMLKEVELENMPINPQEPYNITTHFDMANVVDNGEFTINPNTAIARVMGWCIDSVLPSSNDPTKIESQEFGPP